MTKQPKPERTADNKTTLRIGDLETYPIIDQTI